MILPWKTFMALAVVGWPPDTLAATTAPMGNDSSWRGWWPRPQPQVHAANSSEPWWLSVQSTARTGLNAASASFNETYSWAFGSSDKPKDTESGWDGFMWVLLDLLFSSIGWAIFGEQWGGVKTGFMRALRLLVFFILP